MWLHTRKWHLLHHICRLTCVRELKINHSWSQMGCKSWSGEGKSCECRTAPPHDYNLFLLLTLLHKKKTSRSDAIGVPNFEAYYYWLSCCIWVRAVHCRKVNIGTGLQKQSSRITTNHRKPKKSENSSQTFFRLYLPFFPLCLSSPRSLDLFFILSCLHKPWYLPVP